MDRANPLLWPAADITGDGRFSVDDLGVWAVHLLFLPGDAALAMLLAHAPSVAAFLQLGSDDYGSTVSRAISVIAWFAAWLVVCIVINAIRNLDRTLTAWLAARFEDTKRTLRVTRRKLTSWIGLMRSRRQAKSPGLEVTELALERIDTAVLRCFADVGEMRVLATTEVAKSLDLSLRQAQAVLRKLADHRLVERGFGTDEGLEGHYITQAGQIYLLER